MAAFAVWLGNHIHAPRTAMGENTNDGLATSGGERTFAAKWTNATYAGQSYAWASLATISSLAFLAPLVAMGPLAVFGLSMVTIAIILGALLAIIGAVLSSTSS